MPSEIVPDVLEIEMETLEAYGPDPSQPETFAEAYPFPRLRRTGTTKLVTLRTLILSNDFSIVTFCVDLGGRIIAWHDKRTGLDVIPMLRRMPLSEGGSRGVTLPLGIEIVCGPNERGNAMGPVEFIVDDGSEEGTVSVSFFEIVHQNELSYQATWSLEPDSAGLNLAMRVSNRSSSPRLGASGLQCAAPYKNNHWVFESSRNIYVHTSAGCFDQETIRRSKYMPHLESGQVDSWEATLVPVTGVIDPVSTPNLSAGLTESHVAVLAHTAHLKSKLVLSIDGQAMETSLDLSPGPVQAIDLGELGPRVQGAVFLSHSKDELLRYPRNSSDPAVSELEMSLRDAGKRAAAHVELARESMKAQDWAAADQHLENSLLYNGDDSLTWWLKAVVQRHLNGVDQERPELLNAHFLSPLEPSLRIESFLSQNHQAKEPNPIMAPFATDPDAALDVVNRLLHFHLISDATKVLDELLRHRDRALFRYLWAGLHLTNSAMEFEAAQHVQAAEKLPIEPPFPFRSAEKDMLFLLSDRFPNLVNLQTWTAMAASITKN